jgi:hypothetical protein
MGDTTYLQVFHSIMDSSIWFESSDKFKVWMTVLLMSDRHGYVGASLAAIARRANLGIDVTRDAITAFELPDPDSRSENDEGRRIRRVDRGWEVINYKKLRETAAAERARESKRLSAERRRRRERSTVESTVEHRDQDQDQDQESKDPPIAPQGGPTATTTKRPRATRASRAEREIPLPADWQPNERHREMASRWQLSLVFCADAMRDWAAANAQKCVDWDARFRNWLRSDAVKRGTYTSVSAEETAQKAARADAAIAAQRAAKLKDLPE